MPSDHGGFQPSVARDVRGMSRAVFLDRDGTMIRDKHYLGDPEGVEWFPGARKALRRLHETGFKLVVVTNQSGVARGLIEERDVQSVHERIRRDLRDCGVSLAGIYYCPYLADAPREEYRRESPMRKPAPGMIRCAARELDLTPGASYMVGDKPSDVEAGRRADCSTVLVRTGADCGSLEEGDAGDRKPDAVRDDLPGAVEWILRDGGDAGGDR